jgi:integrase
VPPTCIFTSQSVTTAVTIDAFSGWIAGREVSTINRELATLRRMFKLVPDLRPDLSFPEPRAKLLKGENRRERVVSAEEEKLYLEGAPAMLKNIATIMIDCGFRPEEIYKLEWSFIWNDGAGAAIPLLIEL